MKALRARCVFSVGILYLFNRILGDAGFLQPGHFMPALLRLREFLAIPFNFSRLSSQYFTLKCHMHRIPSRETKTPK